MAKYPCPCCGYLVFDEGPGSHAICEVCRWEDDVSQLRFATASGANRPLFECQQQFIAANKPAEPGHRRDLKWRPLDLAVDHVEVPKPGQDYGLTYAEDFTTYYYWRD